MVIIVHKSKLPAVLLTVLIVVLVGALAFFAYKYFVPAQTPPTPDGDVIAPLPFVPAEIGTEIENEKYHTITASYPPSAPEVKAYVDKAKSELLMIVPKTEADAGFEGLGDGRKYTMTVKTKVVTSPTTMSYVVENYMFTGGAHGITDIVTFTYDGDGKLVTLDNLLKDGSSLTTLSEKARAFFYEKFGEAISEEVIDQGTTPVNQNWERFYLNDQGIVFIFGQYSIGPYILGIQEFVVTYNEAQSFLNIPSR